MAQGMTYKDFEARMAAARAAHLKNINITGKKIQGIYTQAARSSLACESRQDCRGIRWKGG